MKRSMTWFLALVSMVGFVQALELKDLQEDLRKSQQQLNEFREAELAKNLKLAEELSNLETKLSKAREEIKLIELGRKGRDELNFSVKKQVQSYKHQFNSIESLLGDFEVQFWLQSRHEIQGSSDTNLDPLVAKLGSVSAATDVIEAQLGGNLADGKVVNANGDLVSGQTFELGPLAWFQSANKSEAGVVQFIRGNEFGNLDSSVDQGAMASLFAGEDTKLMLDLTGGKARLIAKIQDDPLRLFEKGGVWIWPIIAIALISLVCGIVKFIELKSMKEPDGEWLGSLLTAIKAGEIEKAEILCDETQHPVGEVIKKSLSFVESGAEVVDEVIFEQMIGVQNRMQRWLPFIAVTAAAAPLLGLLGTVSGMIRMFNVITVTGTGDVKPMAGGISEALTTTLFGLVVAIPALVLHTMLSRRSTGVVQVAERLGLSFTNGLKK